MLARLLTALSLVLSLSLFASHMSSAEFTALHLNLWHAAFANWKTWNVAHRHIHQAVNLSDYPLPFLAPPVLPCVLAHQSIGQFVSCVRWSVAVFANQFKRFMQTEWMSGWVDGWVSVYEWVFVVACCIVCCCCCCCCCLFKCCSDSAQIEFLHVRFSTVENMRKILVSFKWARTHTHTHTLAVTRGRQRHRVGISLLFLSILIENISCICCTLCLFYI